MSDQIHPLTIFIENPVLNPNKTSKLQQGERRDYKARRSHNKSRNGCRTCKTRRIKCDEHRPICGQCSYGSRSCIYSPSALQHPMAERFQPTGIPRQKWVDLSATAYVESTGPWKKPPPTVDPQELLSHFVCPAPVWIGSFAWQQIFQQNGLRLSVTAPYLRYAIMSFSAYHMAATRSDPRDYHAVGATYYSYSLEAYTVALRDIEVADRDALYACSLLLAMLAFKSLSLGSQSPDSGDRDQALVQNVAGLRSMQGFHVLQNVPTLQSGLDHSIWRPVVRRCGMNAPDPPASRTEHSEIRDIMDGLEKLCGLGGENPAAANPYAAALDGLRRLMMCEAGYDRVGPFFCFTKSLDTLTTLLENNEKKVMLLFCYWYAMAAQIDQWWILDSARLEGLRLLHFLQKYGSRDIQEFLQFPSERLESDGRQWRRE